MLLYFQHVIHLIKLNDIFSIIIIRKIIKQNRFKLEINDIFIFLSTKRGSNLFSKNFRGSRDQRIGNLNTRNRRY